MITFSPLEESKHTHFAKNLYESAFPREERLPFDQLKEREQRNFHFLVITIDDDDPIGILSYWTFEEITYIEHFAISKDFRNKGFGKASILNFMMQFPDQIILEIEQPTTETAEHRLEFYTDLGFTQNPQPYVQPSYYKNELAIPMIIMSKYELDDGEFQEVCDLLYQHVYHFTPKK